MQNTIRLVLALHNHQPLGNFDGVIEQAYQDSYLPFLDVLERYHGLCIALHTSGCLLEWIDKAHPEYVERLRKLVASGQVEIIGGALYEPILSMVPNHDRIGQIEAYSRWLKQLLGVKVRGMWTPERVWEQSFVSDLAAAGIEYTILDDYHFKTAGLVDEDLYGYYLSEDNGRLLKIFPGSERLRYAIPFESPQATVDYLRHIAESQPGAVVLFGDDGEKFGTWPGTKKYVYDDGWLQQFFDALTDNQSWIEVTTPSAVIDHLPPAGKIYLPDGSYREMTEWVLPAKQLVEYEHVRHEMKDDPRWGVLSRFVRGGYWRNFRVKYSEADEMYTRMLSISQRLQQMTADEPENELLEEARRELYRGQCNCAYWHGAFGGIYLPHLRNAVYHHLIAADNLLEMAAGRSERWVDASAGDYNLDARQEVRLANDKLVALVAPARGGQLYELDVRGICHNLLATLSRRPEAYHQKVLGGATSADDHVASIHDRVVFKQEGLDERLQYDSYRRKSLLDHFYEVGTSAEDVAAGRALELGDFVHAVFEARLRRGQDRVQVELTGKGHVADRPLTITKSLTMEAGSSTIQIAYQLEGVPADRPLEFSVEFNFAGLPAGADDRYFVDTAGNCLGQLGGRLDLQQTTGVGLTDEWLGINAALSASREGGIWTYPIETVSQSEGGFELVHQSVVVQPHWTLEPDAQGRWSVELNLSLDTSRARSRTKPTAVAVTS